MNESKVYRNSAAVARQNDELDLYRESMKLSRACSEFIYQAIRQHYAENHLEAACVEMVLSAYPPERVAWVLAHTLQELDDGRFSRNNMEWAKGFDIPKYEYTSFIVNTHPAILNGFVDLARKAILEKAFEPDKDKPPALHNAEQRYTYYSVHRPVDIGTIPMQPKPERVINFDFRLPVENGAFEAWGCVYYHQPLSEKQINDYELRAASTNPIEKASLLDSLKKERSIASQPPEKKKEARLTENER